MSHETQHWFIALVLTGGSLFWFSLSVQVNATSSIMACM